MKKLTRAAAGVAVAGVALGGTSLAAAGPAAAAASSHCKTSTVHYALPGKPDVSLKTRLCVEVTRYADGNDAYVAKASKISWKGSSSHIGGKRFNGLYLKLRLEHHNKTGKSVNIPLKKLVNGHAAGHTYPQVFPVGVTRTNNWTADATVYGDVAGDGKGTIAKGLHGTAAVK